MKRALELIGWLVVVVLGGAQLFLWGSLAMLVARAAL